MAEREPELDESKVRHALLRRLPKAGLGAQGEMRFPVAPGLADEYAQQLSKVFSTLGRPFNAAEIEHLRGILERKLSEGFKASPYAVLVVSYETDPLPKTTLTYKIGVHVSTMADEYAYWVKTRTPPLFGSHPDAKVMDLARSLGVPAEAPVLDVGAGTGRNTLPLARAGHPTDAVEVSPDLAAILRAELGREGLAGRVFEADILATSCELPRAHYRLMILCEVVSHFRHLQQVRVLFERAAELLVPGGLLAFSVFLPEAGYEPDQLTRELSEVFWCTLFTEAELQQSSEGLPFERVSDESVFEYERTALPEEAWPPTGWFSEWTTGLDLFDLPQGEAPIDMRWLVYRRS